MKNSLPMHKLNSSHPIRGGMLGLLLVLAACSPSEPESQGTEPRVRLVTSDQYLNSLRYILGSGIELQVEFPPFERTEGLLGNSAATAGISSSLLEQVQGAAASVARQVVGPAHRNFFPYHSQCSRL